MPIHINLSAKAKSYLMVQFLCRNILFCNSNMNCGSTLLLKRVYDAFNQING